MRLQQTTLSWQVSVFFFPLTQRGYDAIAATMPKPGTGTTALAPTKQSTLRESRSTGSSVGPVAMSSSDLTSLKTGIGGTTSRTEDDGRISFGPDESAGADVPVSAATQCTTANTSVQIIVLVSALYPRRLIKSTIREFIPGHY